MENKDTSTDYQKFVGVRDQKWEVVEITIGIFFFLLEIYIHYFLYLEFSSHPHLKFQFPPKIPIGPKSFL